MERNDAGGGGAHAEAGACLTAITLVFGLREVMKEPDRSPLPCHGSVGCCDAIESVFALARPPHDGLVRESAVSCLRSEVTRLRTTQPATVV